MYSHHVIGTVKLKKTDLLLCESPPLFLGISALFLKGIKRAKLIFNVSDLWPETAEKLGLITNGTLLNITTHLEEYLYKKSALVTGQTMGIVKNIKDRFPSKAVYWLPNGVDVGFYNNTDKQENWRERNGFNDNDFLVLYAGIIGHAQGLEVVLKAANEIKEPSVKFIVLGAGPEREKLMALKEEMNLSNVIFIEPVQKSTMPSVWSSVNVSLVPLRRIELFKGAIPSKIFESMAMKKPYCLE